MKKIPKVIPKELKKIADEKIVEAKDDQDVAIKKIGRPTVVTADVRLKLKQAFSMGASDEEACYFADIAPATLYDYQKRHPTFLETKNEWKQNPILKARATLFGDLVNPDSAKWFLERKKKDEFSSRTEVATVGKVTMIIEEAKKEMGIDDQSLEEEANGKSVPTVSDVAKGDVSSGDVRVSGGDSPENPESVPVRPETGPQSGSSG